MVSQTEFAGAVHSIGVALKVGSLFSGIGGIDLGFIQSGFDIAWANEIDPHACITYRHNFPDTILIEGDIRKIDENKLADIDVLAAGFPCQPFSVMGYRRGFKDPRGNLFFELARIIDRKKPRIVFLENVKNLVYHDNGKTFLVIYSALAELGYSVRYKIVNAVDVNIPQNRARIFIVGFLDPGDCDVFSFPEFENLTKTIDDILDRTVKHDDSYYYDSGNRYFQQLDMRMKGMSGIYRIDDSGVAMKKYKICPTLKANMGTYHDRVPIIRDRFGIRKLTPRECLDFQGYPADFGFKGIPIESAYKQIGNSVCVPVIKRIAEKIYKLF